MAVHKFQENKFSLQLSVKDYYSSLIEDFLKAERKIIIIGWDIHTEVDLSPHEKRDDLPTQLYPFLNHLVKEKPDLQIFLLPWKYAWFYALERDPLLGIKFGWASSKNIHFKADSTGPIESSEHQKIVIVDDTVAYCGGMDITIHRWDDENHKAVNNARVLPNGKTYPPYHDMQVRCTGPIVQKFIAIAYARWNNASSAELEFLKSLNSNINPYGKGLKLKAEQARVLQTIPRKLEKNSVREIEEFYSSKIKAAQKYIYIENQYLTSKSIIEALIKRLNENNPPEVLIILPKHSGGWLEQETMGRLQAKKCTYLLENVDQDQVKILYPHNSELSGDEYMTVHSKVMLVDDVDLFVGSANLNNRSMGLDSEVGLHLQGKYHFLLNHFLSVISGVTREQVKEILSDYSLLDSIEKINERSENKKLQEMDCENETYSIPDKFIPDESYLDVEKPARLNQEVYALDEETENNWNFLKKIHQNLGLIIMIVLAFSVAFIWNGLSKDNIIKEQVQVYLDLLRASDYQYLITSAIYFVSAMLFIPINLLIVITATAFRPTEAFFITILGTSMSVFSTYLMGVATRMFNLKKKLKNKENKAVRMLKHSSFSMLIIIRIIPTVPNTVLGIIAGYSRIPLIKFVFSSAVGFLPGIIAFIYFQQSLIEIIKEPSWKSLLVSTAIMALLIIAFQTMKRNLAKFNHDF